MVTDAVIPVEKCKPHERNYNAHSETQIADLAESLRQFGQVRSIVVQAQKGKTFLLVAGHGIWLAAKKAGLKELRANVIPASWSKTKVLAYLAADNELSRRGSPDEEQLAAIVRDVCEAEGEAMAALAAGERAALDKILAIEAGEADAEPQVDRAAELQEKWQTALGQLWQIGPHRLLCGDSTRREDVERVMGGERADLLFSDPPYNVNIVGGTHDPRDKKNYGIGPKIENDNMSDEEFDKFLFGFLEKASEVMSSGAAFYLCSPPGSTETQFRNAINCVSGLQMKQGICWAKQQFVFGRSDYHYQHETILYGWKEGSHYFIDDRTQSTLWNFDRPMRSEKEHPTQKPVALVERAVKNSSKAGGTVYEPFAGSGTTLVACQNLGRVCRAIEISPAYCAVILERMVTAFPALDIHKVD